MILILKLIFVSFYEFCKCHFVVILQIKVLCSVSIFLGIFCIVVIYVSVLSSGYDAQLMLSTVKPRYGKVTAILNNMECYSSFTMNGVTFIDSCQFMVPSPDKLASNLRKYQFRETRKYLKSFYVQQLNQPQNNDVTESGEVGEAMHAFEDYRSHPHPKPPSSQQQQIEEDLALLTGKGVYPYEFMDSFERFQELQLPPKDTFYSSLTEEDISEIDYTHTQRVFNHFDMTGLGDYHNTYLLINVLLLADVFENFRDVWLQHYHLDPDHNYTSPGLL